MFGSNKYQSQNQTDPAVAQVTNPLHAAVGVSENQIEQVPLALAPVDDAPQQHVMATAPTAPPVNNPVSIDQSEPDLTVDSTANAHDSNSIKAEYVTDKILSHSANGAKSTQPEQPPARRDDVGHGDLLDIKKGALQSLAPLVGKLDQTPEEKFKTTMMLIQASDNAQLIKEAYESANSITDEKSRAQALLDVINEINYFTQQSKETTNPSS